MAPDTDVRPFSRLALGETTLVHDYLLVMRGAERTFAAMAACWPGAPIATLLYDEERTRGHFASHPVTTSLLQRLPVRQRGFRGLLPLLPIAAETLPVPDARLVVSSSSAFAHGVRVPDGAAHVCYCHSPFRYAYHEFERALSEAPRAVRPALARMLRRIRAWQRRVAGRPTGFIANSQLTRERIQDFWNRDAPVVHPPVEVGRFAPGTPEDYFLVVGELVRHKCPEIALEAGRLARRRVVVVGDGPERQRLEARYGSTAEFAGRVSDARLAALYAGALAVVVPNVEEFGIAAVEAQAAGRPVLALDRGGTAETVVPGETGVLVCEQDAATFAEAMDDPFERFDVEAIRRNAERFSVDAFQRKLVAEVRRLAGPLEARPADPGAIAA